MTAPRITFFPVGNGDCTLVEVGELRALIDCSPRVISGDPHFDVEEMRELILPLLEREDGRYLLDGFLLTHPHKDHLWESDKLLHFGRPEIYDPSSKKILVNEIIYAPQSFEAVGDEELHEDAKAFLREVERRLSADASSGNLITAVLAPDEEDPGADRSVVVGDVIDEFGEMSDDRLSIRVFAPRGVIDPEDRNDLSAVFQVRISAASGGEQVKAILGGDAPRPVWESIYEDEDLEEFRYDLLLAPHHCSWTTFAESSDDEASKSAKSLFETNRGEAKIVSSSFEIESEKNPPSTEAAAIYEEIVGEDNFLCTGEYPEKGELEPIIFEITDQGLIEIRGEKKRASYTGIELLQRTPEKYG